MFAPLTLPAALLEGPFTTAEAERHGVSRAVQSSSSRFRSLFRGVWVHADVELSERVRIKAALLVLPADAVVSHVTALRLLGVDFIEDGPLHFSTNTALRARHDDLVLHRRLGTLHPSIVDGLPVTGPDRSFVDSATLLRHLDLVRAGDTLVRYALTTPARLCSYALERHLDGVVRARRAAPSVRSGVDSVRETDLRLLLRFARLPEPEVNTSITDESGNFLARGDLVYRAYKVVVEYDGWHHERDARQRRKDLRRRERLEAAGWRVLVVTSDDFNDPMGIVRRVYTALAERGYRGPKPVMSLTWQLWFNAA